jgi:hypothetical protein
VNGLQVGVALQGEAQERLRSIRPHSRKYMTREFTESARGSANRFFSTRYEMARA